MDTRTHLERYGAFRIQYQGMPEKLQYIIVKDPTCLIRPLGSTPPSLSSS
jgi:hypothetical protein